MKKIDAMLLLKQEISDLLTLYKMKSPDNTGDEFSFTLAKNMMAFFEDTLGMAPPHLPNEQSQCVADVYIYPIYNMWEEDFDRDPNLTGKMKNREIIRKAKEECEKNSAQSTDKTRAAILGRRSE